MFQFLALRILRTGNYIPLMVLFLYVLIIEMNKTVTFLNVFSMRVWSRGSLWCRSIG